MALHDAVQAQLKEMTKDFEHGRAVVAPLRAQLVEAACDDPGAVLIPHLIVPLLKERLEAKAAAYQVCYSPDAHSSTLAEVQSTCEPLSWPPQ